MRRSHLGSVLVSFIAVAAASGCREEKASPPPERKAQAQPAKPAAGEAAGDDAVPTAAWSWEIPKGLGEPPTVPDANPMSRTKVALGHKLFMDKRLSVDGSRSCYSCHQNHLGNADGRPKALGPGNKDLPRNSPTIWNVAYQPVLYWDGRAADLEAQAIGALKGGNMGLGDGLEAKAKEIGELPEYKPLFAEAFGLDEGTPVTPEHIAQALSAYERTLLCGDTAYDRQDMSEAAERGMAVFMQKGACVTCHNGPNFSDGLFHRTGIGVDPKDPDGDLGRGAVTKSEEDNYKFRTPTLRNVAKTAPYFHDGSVATLEEAVRLMAAGGKPDIVAVDSQLVDRKLTDDEIADVVAFLETLSCSGELEVIGDQTVEGIPGPVAEGGEAAADKAG